MKRCVVTAVTIAVLGAFTGLTQAASVGMNIYNDTKAGGANLGAIGVNVDVVDTGSAYSFTVSNTSTILSSITHLYFDNSLASVLSGGPSLSTSGLVLFDAAPSNPAPPFSANIGWTGTLSLLKSVGANDEFKIKRGINDGGSESLTVSFAKVGGTVLQDVIDLLTNTGGIVAHLVDLQGNGMTTNVDLTTLASQGGTGNDDQNSVAIPTPASAAAGLALLSLLAARRRQR